MNGKTEFLYVSPEAEIIETPARSVICESPQGDTSQYNPHGDVTDWF